MSNWIKSTIEELAAKEPSPIVDGPFGSNLKVSDYVEVGIPVLQGGNVTGNRFNLNDIRFIKKEKARSLYRSNAKVGDLITVKIGSVGYSAIIDSLGEFEYSIIPANLLRSRFDSQKIATRYIYYYLTSHYGKKKLLDLASNTAQPALSLGGFKSLKICHPSSRSEQNRITEILSAADEAIAHTESLISKYTRIKTGLMQALLTRGIDEQGKIRSKVTHKFVMKNGIEVSEEWEVLTVGELIAERIVDEIQDGNHGEKHPKSKDFTDVGIPFIMASDISNNEIDLSNCNRISKEQYLTLRIGFAKPGDVLLSHKASIGFVAKVPDFLAELMLTPQVTYYRVKDTSRLTSDYLAYFMKGGKFQTSLSNLAKQSTRDYIGITMQKDLAIAFPKSCDEQEYISKVLQSIEKYIKQEHMKLIKYSKLKTGLMQDLLSGKRQVELESES